MNFDLIIVIYRERQKKTIIGLFLWRLQFDWNFKNGLCTTCHSLFNTDSSFLIWTIGTQDEMPHFVLQLIKHSQIRKCSKKNHKMHKFQIQIFWCWAIHNGWICAFTHFLEEKWKKTSDQKISMQVHSKQDSLLSKQSLYKSISKPTNGNLVRSTRHWRHKHLANCIQPNTQKLLNTHRCNKWLTLFWICGVNEFSWHCNFHNGLTIFHLIAYACACVCARKFHSRFDMRLKWYQRFVFQRSKVKFNGKTNYPIQIDWIIQLKTDWIDKYMKSKRTNS